MGHALVVVAILAGGVVLWAVLCFNRFTRQRFLLKEAWSGIDVQLKRRHDLVPNLVEVVRAYAKHESSVLEDVTRLRSVGDGDLAARGAGENALTKDLRGLLAVVESYPDLKADKNFMDLSAKLVEIEDQIQYARRYYNGTVRDLNILVESFPSLLVAKAMGVTTAPYFEIATATERESPKVAL